MTTANYNKGLNINNDLITALYCRLSVEDIKDENGKKKRNIDESNSISNQDAICQGAFLQKLQIVQQNLHEGNRGRIGCAV